MLTKDTSRRAMLAGLAVTVPAIMVGTAVQARNLSGDAAIEAAWARRQAAYATYNELPAEEELLIAETPYTPEEARMWAIIDEAEEVIRSTVATTPRGAEIQLWCALYHSIIRQEDDKAVTRGDLAWFERQDSGMDWNGRLMLAALRSLQQIRG